MNEMTNPVIRPALAAADQRQRRARLEAIGAGAVTLVVVIAFFAIAAGGAGASIWFPLAVGYYTYFRRLKGVGVVLWLRRFHPNYGMRFRFHQSLGGACAALGVPVTIQDDAFKFSYLAAQARLMPFILAIALLALVFVAFVAVVVSSMFGFSAAAAIVGLIIGLTIVARTVPKLLRRFGLATFAGPAGAARAKRRLARLARSPRSPGHGVAILKCSDDIWQEVVADALRICRAVVIDVTDVTINLEWEINRALELVGEGGIVLAAEEGTSLQRVRAALASISGSPEARDWLPVDTSLERWVSERLVTYPATKPSTIDRKKVFTELQNRLREKIALALTAPTGKAGRSVRVAS